MIGIWLVVLFVIIPGGIGAGVAFAFSQGQQVTVKKLAVGALIGIVLGVTAGILLFRY